MPLKLLNLFLYILSYLTCGTLNVYLIDRTLRYRVRRPKIIYPVTAGAGVLFALVTTYFYETLYRAADGSVSAEFDSVSANIVSVFFLFIGILLFFSLREKWWKRLLIVIFATDLLQRLNNIFTTATTLFIPADFPEGTDPIIMIIGIELLFTLLEFLFCFVVGRIGERNSAKPLPIPFIIIIDLVVGIVSEIGIDGVWYSEEVSRTQITVLLMLLSLSIMVIFSYISGANRERADLRAMNAQNEEYINAQTRHFEQSAAADTEVRAMRHDMRNNIQVLMLLLEKGEYDKMREYLEEMGDGLRKADVSLHTGSAIADAIISEKISEAASKGITLNCSGVISGVELTPVDTCKILANILDNAIEACGEKDIKDLPERVIELQFKKTDNHFMITCSNPSAHYVDLDGGDVMSTKKDKKSHGFGIRNIKAAAANYGGEINSECEETEYGYRFSLDIIFPLDA